MEKADYIAKQFDNAESGKTNYLDTVKIMTEAQNDSGFKFDSIMKQVNSSVDMKSQGFSEDFELLRVMGNGNVLTRSEDGKYVQERDPVHLQVLNSKDALGASEKWGKRDFDVRSDGTAEYEIKKGDNLWGITKDTLQERLGRKPTQTEISESYKQIAEANNIEVANKLKIGQKLLIPQGGKVDVEKLPDTQKPTIDFSSDTAKGVDGTFNAMSTPGFNGTDESWISNKKVDSQIHGNETVRTSYSGDIDGSGWNNPKFTASETTDSFGRIKERNISYDGSGLNLTVDTGFGQTQDLEGIKNIATVFNPITGNYDSRISLNSGAKYNSVTDANGKVIRFSLM